MKPLTYTERARLKRQGCTVVAERDGIAKCITEGGGSVWYCVEHLREIAKPSIGERLRAWIAGVAV